MSCDGCTVSMTGAGNPALEDLLAGSLPEVPRIRLHHPMLSEHSGQGFLEPFRAAAAGSLGAPYIVVLEGSVPDDLALPANGGYYAGLGAG
ncbi:MAG: hydrogenase expression protein HypE, partial [Actinomycetota bacterium]|nr:hydrogenase expression protein HypE [Actinomycetota bacterium]